MAEDESYRESWRFERDRRFWRETFRTAPELARLDGGGDQIAVLRKESALSSETTAALGVVAAAARTNWTAVLVAATAAYLNGVTGTRDLVVGMPVAARVTERAAHGVAQQADVERSPDVLVRRADVADAVGPQVLRDPDVLLCRRHRQPTTVAMRHRQTTPFAPASPVGLCPAESNEGVCAAI
ncbi:hypothetical protein K7G98_30235 [Saccharothrix sp. MB29]|nr:hypothetical protein [Saccharothrix sp. MB29]